MATVSKLVLGFRDEDGKEKKMNYNYANPNVETSDVVSAMDAIIANGAIFSNVPVAKKNAKIITTQETSIDIS